MEGSADDGDGGGLGGGIIGKVGDPANRICFGLLAVGLIVAARARFRAAALAQALVAAIAPVAGPGLPWSDPVEILLPNGFFVALLGGSAMLFHKGAQGQADVGWAQGEG